MIVSAFETGATRLRDAPSRRDPGRYSPTRGETAALELMLRQSRQEMGVGTRARRPNSVVFFYNFPPFPLTRPAAPAVKRAFLNPPHSRGAFTSQRVRP